eukprot:scaffold5708_cov142-Cylindrotheca_fusiformis.AAC.1
MSRACIHFPTLIWELAPSFFFIPTDSYSISKNRRRFAGAIASPPRTTNTPTFRTTHSLSARLTHFQHDSLTFSMTY